MGGGEDQKEGRQWGLPYPLFHNLVLGVILCPQSVRALGSDCVWEAFESFKIMWLSRTTDPVDLDWGLEICIFFFFLTSPSDRTVCFYQTSVKIRDFLKIGSHCFIVAHVLCGSLQPWKNRRFIQHWCFLLFLKLIFFPPQFWRNYVSLVIIHFKNSWAVWRTFMKIHLDKIRYYCLMRWHFNLDLASGIYQEFFMEELGSFE